MSPGHLATSAVPQRYVGTYVAPHLPAPPACLCRGVGVRCSNRCLNRDKLFFWLGPLTDEMDVVNIDPLSHMSSDQYSKSVPVDRVPSRLAACPGVSR